MKLTFRFTRSSSIVSKAIQFWTWGKWSHVELVLSEGYLGALPSGGVQIRPVGYSTVSEEEIVSIEVSIEEAEKVISFTKSQIGKKYDWTVILGFIVRRDWRETDHWDCSELLMEALNQAGIPTLNTKFLNRIDPNTFYLIPLFSTTK